MQEEALDCAYQSHVELFTSTLLPDEPTTYQDAVESPHLQQWHDAIVAKLQAMEDINVWDIIPRPQDTNVISCKWVFRLKHDADGKISHFKARLVTRGFMQVYGTDYLDTYAPVTRLEMIRLLFALAIKKDWEIRQINVKTAYLNGDLNKEIFMEPPQGYNVPEGHVLLLKKVLYRLKQARQQWYKHL